MADSVKTNIKALKDFMAGKPSVDVPDSTAFGRTLVMVIEEMSLRLEAMEREVGPSGAFISSIDGSHPIR